MDWSTIQQRLTELLAEPRANVPAVAVLGVIVAALLVLLAMAFLEARGRGKGHGGDVIVDADGKRYMIVRSEVVSEDPRRRIYAWLSAAFLVAAIASAVFAWALTA